LTLQFKVLTCFKKAQQIFPPNLKAYTFAKASLLPGKHEVWNSGTDRVTNETGKLFSSQTKFSQTGFFKNSWAASQIQLDYMSIIAQQDATIFSLFISVNCSTCFGWYLHPSSGAHVTVSTKSGISKTVIATCRERDWTEPSSHVHNRLQSRFY